MLKMKIHKLDFFFLQLFIFFVGKWIDQLILKTHVTCLLEKEMQYFI